jgi:hypothetical protein
MIPFFPFGIHAATGYYHDYLSPLDFPEHAEGRTGASMRYID